jgi:hypothetical protein
MAPISSALAAALRGLVVGLVLTQIHALHSRPGLPTNSILILCVEWHPCFITSHVKYLNKNHMIVT